MLDRGWVRVRQTCPLRARFGGVLVEVDDELRPTYRFQDLSDGDVVERLWDFGDPASGADNRSSDAHPEHRFSGPGSYRVRLTVTDRHGRTRTRVEELVFDPGFVPAG